MKIELEIDDHFMDQLKLKLNCHDNIQLTKDAFTLLNWVATEVLNGRKIYSTDLGFLNVKELDVEYLKSFKSIIAKNYTQND